MPEPLVPSLPRIDLGSTTNALSRLLQWGNQVFRNAEASINRWETGTFTVSDTDTQAEVTIARQQSDANYLFLVTPLAISGTPADLAHSIASVQRAQQSATVTLKAAPGAGASITYSYLVAR